MIFTKKANSDAPQCNVYLNDKKLEQVEHFKYLGCTLSWNCREDKEMNMRLGQAKSTFKKMKPIFCSKNLTFKSRFRVLNCYIYPVFLPTAQKQGIYQKPWSHEFKHSRCGALEVCNEFHEEQESQIKMSLGKLAIIPDC